MSQSTGFSNPLLELNCAGQQLLPGLYSLLAALTSSGGYARQR